MIDITGMDKAVVLSKLYNHAQVQGMGFLNATPEDMTVDEAKKIINDGFLKFDYLHGRVMKVGISGDELSERFYDRDNGPGAAQRALDSKQ